jgi:alpha-mannosidase
VNGEPGRLTLQLAGMIPGRTLEAEFGPSQIRTFRVPRDAQLDIVDVDLLEWPLDAEA